MTGLWVATRTQRLQ